MAKEDLASWISKQKKAGFTDEQLKVKLLQSGYGSDDINEAFASVTKHGGTSVESGLLRPRFLNVTIALILIILLFVSYVVNVSHLPSMGDVLCIATTGLNDLQQAVSITRMKSLEKDASADDVMDMLTDNRKKGSEIQKLYRESAAHIAPIGTGNMLLLSSGIYSIYPLFPASCELKSLGGLNTGVFSCAYYISEEDHRCLETQLEISSQASLEGGVLGINNGMPKYSKVALPAYIMHSLIFAAIIYVSVSLLMLFHRKVSKNGIKEKMIFACAALAVGGVPALIFDHYLFLIVGFIMAVSFFLPHDDTGRKVAMIVTIVMILAFAGIHALAWSSFNTTLNTQEETERISYEVTTCRETKLLSIDEKLAMGLDGDYLDQEWEVCASPSCADSCRSECGDGIYDAAEIIMLRGENPSCICGCLIS
jgi:hypothetical protein